MLKSRRLDTHSAMLEAATATAHEARVRLPAKPRRIGSEKPSMPTKCIAQMPVPMASEPTAHQTLSRRSSERRTRWARSSAPKAARVAMSSEVATIHGSWLVGR